MTVDVLLLLLVWGEWPLHLSGGNYLLPRYHGSSEQVRQDEARGFGLHTVNPEVGTAGVVLMAPVHQLEVVCLRVERLLEWKGEIL